MAEKPKPMSQIKQRIRLSLQGSGKKHIARTLGISRNTVKSYLDKIALDGVPALAKNTDPKVFAKACSIALEHQNYSWRFIDNLVKNNMTAHQDPPLSKQLPKHGNVRGRDYYQQTFTL